MKLKLTLLDAAGASRDIILECDVTATVGDAARALWRAGASGAPRLADAVALRLLPVTLRGRAGATGEAILLDPGSPVAVSGLQSGWQVEAVAEFGDRGPERRMIDPAGYVEVRSGAQRGVVYSVITGANTVGRDPGSRVLLTDPSVSRRHAEIAMTASGVMRLRDYGSVNGTRRGEDAITELDVTVPTDVTFGDVAARVIPGPPARQTDPAVHNSEFTRSPRVVADAPGSTRELPTPPAPRPPTRVPAIAMLAPVLMGGAMYLVTQSPMSLMMMAFSPLMMIGSWADHRFGGRLRQKRDTAQFHAALTAERDELERLRREESAARTLAAPGSAEVADAIRQRSRLLWTRRAEHRDFLQLRFGTGRLPSRTAVALPPRGDASQACWDELRRIEQEYATVAPVPVVEHLGACGSLGIAGDAFWAGGLARSLTLQLVALHSPADVALACFASPAHHPDWGWLKWLPHVDAATSPIAGPQLAADERGAARLIMELEGVLATRRAGQLATPVFLVLVLDTCGVDPARLIALAESGPDHGLHLLWLAGRPEQVPAACRTFVTVSRAHGTANFVREGTSVPLIATEHVEPVQAAELARRLAPVEDTAARVLDESDLPRAVQLRDLHQADLLGGAASILRSWYASGSLVGRWRGSQERDPIALAAVIGQGPDGPVTVDLRAHGPHALVGGTTGAGKSEFLQTWIMSLAATLSPERLTFLLVDYKGGAAFADCVDLPHTVGLVTDLNPHLVRRALTSLRAELRYREELLAAHGAKDLLTLERRSEAAAPPVLVLVIDEFAALMRDVPEFVDGVIDIAQRGRSLGLHLVMATQRPAGVISDALRANTNLRIAFRMADEADSRDVLGVADAATFAPEHPGRGALKVGPGRISHFQAGYLGGRVTERTAAADLSVRALHFGPGRAWDIPAAPRPRADPRARPARDIARVRDSIVAACADARLPAPRRAWLDPLPPALGLGEAARLDNSDDDVAVIGVRDVPAEQAQRPVLLDLEGVGNVAISGASGAGKTGALLAIAAALSERVDRFPVQVYAIDAAGGALGALAALPTVGTVAPLADRELTRRVLAHVRTRVAERTERFAAARAPGLRAFRQTAGGAAESRIVLAIDGFAAFAQTFDGAAGPAAPLHLLGEIMAGGRPAGVHVILTSDRPGALPAAMAAAVQQHYVLRLANPFDYAQTGVPEDALASAPPGRAVLAGTNEELQFAQSVPGAGYAAQVEALERCAAALSARGVAATEPVRNAPRTIALSELPVAVAGRPVYGIDTETFTPVTLPGRGLAVVAGPPGSGLSTAALSCVAAATRWTREGGGRVHRVLLTCASGGLRERGAWEEIAYGEEQVRRRARSLVQALGGRPAARLTSGLQEPDAETAERFPPAGCRGIIVVERPTEMEGSDAIAELAALAKVARRSEVLVLSEFEQGGAGAIWELFTALRQPGWGLALQPDDGGAQSPFREPFGRVNRADFPEGRGMAIESGRVVQVHVAVPPAGDADADSLLGDVG